MANEISMTATQPQDPSFLPELPQEILTDILLKLPVKSIMKFRCVSKSWLLLFSSSHFVKTHLEISTKNNVYSHDRLVFGSKGFPPPMDLYTCSLQSAVDVFVSPSSIYPFIDQDLLVQRVWFDYPSYELDDVIWLVGSCNGLICVSLSVETLILWNPATRKSKILPKSDTDLDFDYYGITFGFGYDDLNDDYKVVEFFSFERVTGTLEIQIKVYSLRANSWKTLLNWPGGDAFGGSGKFLNGAIHWSVSDFDGPVEWEIVSHDLATDTFSVLQLPNIDDEDVRVEVNILGGYLAVCCEQNTHMDIWLMKEYGVRESWTRVACIPFFLDLRDHEFTRPCPLFMTVDGRFLINYGSNLSTHDPRNPQLHHFSTSLEVESITYFESLVSPILEDDISS